MEDIKKDKPTKQGYYINEKLKIIDFFIGFFGAIIVCFVWIAIAEIWLSVIFTLALVGLIIFAVRKKRDQIFWGVIASLMIPFVIGMLLWGYCLLLISGH